MASIDLLPSEASYLELVLRNKAKAERRAARILEKAEEDVDEALTSIFERVGVEEIVGKPKLLRGIDGKPARIVWRDPAPEPKATNGTEHRPDETPISTGTNKDAN
jgi:hypothetical protein